MLKPMLKRRLGSHKIIMMQTYVDGWFEHGLNSRSTTSEKIKNKYNQSDHKQCVNE
jgi:hypothetical protein